ncbi:MAG: leucine-rich repeat domain-containing protein [Ignavibacteria bacterium]|nr:leucine-rich repeat domain-containing protein [Ignavibacteria bacterium]
MSDLDTIKEIEKILGIELNEYTGKEKFINSRTYKLDDKKNVIALSLSDCEKIDLKKIQNPLEKLINISELDLSNNQISDIKPLEKLINISELYLSSNQISDIKPLENLINISSLDLSSNQISDIKPLENLINISSLDLYNNQISDIKPLEKLINISELYLSSNQISDIKPLEKLINISELYLSSNQISDIKPLENLINISELYLSSNQISDIKPLEKLINISSLDLSSNQISDIKPLEKLINISSLYLSSNKIEILPEWIVNSMTAFFYFNQNPLKDPPYEIYVQGWDAVRRYFKNKESEGLGFIREAKLILVGEGGAGKTSLKNRLLDPKSTLPEGIDRTRGITVDDWQISGDKSKDLIHIWDFGGQDVYFPVHRFFMTEKSVFVLLAATKTTFHNFEYWLPTISEFGGDSPIIIGQTCHDITQDWDIDKLFGDEFKIIKFGTSYFIELNLVKNNKGLEEIKNEILKQTYKLEHFERGVLKPWFKVREELKKISVDTPVINFEKFRNICNKADNSFFAKEVNIYDCAKFLHAIGIILWYDKYDSLKDKVILKPVIAMNAVYALIDDKDYIQNAIISKKAFEEIWSEKHYKDNIDTLKNMLEIFKVAFKNKDEENTDEYIIPLKLNKITDEHRWKNNPRVEFRFNKYMPKGLVNQLCAALSIFIQDRTQVWENAVNFESKENPEIKAQVEEIYDNKKIVIRTADSDSRAILFSIVRALTEILKIYNKATYEIYVSCISDKCLKAKEPEYLQSNILAEKYKSGRNNWFCNLEDKELKISEIFKANGLDLPQITDIEIVRKEQKVKKEVRAFISYSSKDIKEKENFIKHLGLLTSKGLKIFDDSKLRLAEKWEAPLLEEMLDNCDVMICLISANFFDSNFIMKKELPRAEELGKKILPVVLMPCAWDKTFLVKYEAAWSGKAIMLDDQLAKEGIYKDSTKIQIEAYCTQIVREISDKLLDGIY